MAVTIQATHEERKIAKPKEMWYYVNQEKG